MYKEKKIEQRKIKKIYVVPVPVGVASREKKYMPKKTKKWKKTIYAVIMGIASGGSRPFSLREVAGVQVRLHRALHLSLAGPIAGRLGSK